MEMRGQDSASGDPTERPFESPFESEVATRLIDAGYKVDPQVGVSGFRIDLGVRRPSSPSVYLAGVECDGAAYHSSKSARDRDRLREEILRDLGWEIIRVWSTDWFRNPARETDKLIQALVKLERKPMRLAHEELLFGILHPEGRYVRLRSAAEALMWRKLSVHARRRRRSSLRLGGRKKRVFIAKSLLTSGRVDSSRKRSTARPRGWLRFPQ